MSNEDFFNLKIYCWECENKDCNFYARNKDSNDRYGCVRRVPEELYQEYIHQYFEEWPFARMLSLENERLCYLKTIDVLYKVYEMPMVHLLGKKGQVLKGNTRK